MRQADLIAYDILKIYIYDFLNSINGICHVILVSRDIETLFHCVVHLASGVVQPTFVPNSTVHNINEMFNPQTLREAKE